MKIGFIGVGRMGSALIRAILNSGIIVNAHIVASDVDKDRLNELKEELKIKTTNNNQKLVKQSDVIFLGVKPKDVDNVLTQIKPQSKGKLIVSIAAGVKTSFIESKLQESRVIRVMPNTPCLVQQNASAFCLGKGATKDDALLVEKVLKSTGLAFEVSEDLMDAVTGLSGSGPAYIYLVIKAITEAGVELGLDRETALKLSAQTTKGAAEMILETNKSPDELIEMVCSPGGTTVEAMSVLEKNGVVGIFKEAVKAAANRSKELSE